MINLQPYPGDALDLYDAILESKRAGAKQEALKRLRPRILPAHYASYEAARTDLDTFRRDPALPLITKEEREALMGCYDSAPTPLAQMKRDVLAALPRAANKCPYCGIGEIGDPDNPREWDHYLPRRNEEKAEEAFPELSVHPTNLVPCCHICNGQKLNRFRESAQRQFINFYYDVIDQTVPLLEAKIQVVPGRDPKVSYDFVRTPFKPFSSLYRRHCDGLDLRRRYASAAGPKIATMEREIRRHARQRSEDYLREFLREEAAALAAQLGINHWEPTLYRAAAESGELLRYCLEDTAGERGHSVVPNGDQPT